MCVAKVGQPAPDFALTVISSDDLEPRPMRLADYAGRWLMLIFYPRDFTFVCPTELTAFSARSADFDQRDCRLLGISCDSIDMHREWLTTPPADGGLGPLRFPLAADPDGAAARAYGIWVEEEKLATRGLFVIDPDGTLQYAVLHNMNVGRNPDEVLRVLDALQTGGLCPASWTSADGTLDPEKFLKPGTVLGHYRIRRKLGGGTFGTVFSALDLHLQRMVAVKILHRSVFDSREAVLSESRAGARLNHPHICIVYAVDEQDGLPLIAMEYVDGQPLSAAIAGGLPRNTVLKLAAQVASGLASAHREGIVHGDLKPANIMVTRTGAAKILDFGLARAQRSSGDETAAPQPPQPAVSVNQAVGAVHDVDATIDHTSSTVEQTAGIRGSLAYMSPEQASGAMATTASDVFSFGLVLFEMLTGRRAHEGQAPAKWVARLQSEGLAAELSGNVDAACRELLCSMLTRAADDRPTMEQVAEEVKRIARA